MPRKNKKTKASLLVKGLRICQDITQKQLSDATGLTIHRIRSFELGWHLPTMQEARKLAKALGCDVMKLLEDRIDRE